ncbi:MAG: hypothetical protein LQ341_002014 [Variospora aurantia]|nr:MAG: hypothetical protein LQ341_002014 [Variospora aurantia]
MEHSHMDHGGMHMPSSDGPKCNMNMLFTWDTTNLCIIFPQWHIYSTFSLFISLIGVIVLTAGYEFVREMSRRYEASSAEYTNKLPSKTPTLREEKGTVRAEAKRFVFLKGEDDDERERNSLLWAGKSAGEAEKKQKIIKAAFYAVQVFYSFFIMLLFMTYNGWIMLAVAVGAFVGYLAFGNSSATKSAACH